MPFKESNARSINFYRSIRRYLYVCARNWKKLRILHHSKLLQTKNQKKHGHNGTDGGVNHQLTRELAVRAHLLRHRVRGYRRGSAQHTRQCRQLFIAEAQRDGDGKKKQGGENQSVEYTDCQRLAVNPSVGE